MISFTPIDKQTAEKLSSLFSDTEDCKTAKEAILSAYDPDEEDTEVSAAVYGGCLLFRIFDMGRYLFGYPQAIGKNADVKAAVSALYEYCMMQEVPYRFIDVYAEDLPILLDGVRRADIEAIDGEGSDTLYSVEVKNELQSLDEIPALESEDGRVILSEIYPADTRAYAALCRNSENNRYWGYDYHDSLEAGKEPTDAWFYEQAKSQFAYRTALYLAVRNEKKKLIGEAELFAFDGHGSAEIAFRISPKEQNQGYGTAALATAVSLCRELGLIRLNGRVNIENLPSLSVVRKVFGKKGRTKQNTVFFTMAL